MGCFIDNFQKLKRYLRKNERWLKVCEEFDKFIETGGRSRKAWKIISRTRQNMQENCNLSLIKMNEWREHFQILLQENRENYKQQIELGQRATGVATRGGND